MKSKRGFTLIELLIVIALLGALAVGLIGAIDPFEQLKKGADTGTRDIVNQVQTAVIRYYSVKNTMPWLVALEPASTDLATDPVKTAIVNMQNAGELRTDFQTIQSTSLSKVFMTGSIANNTVVVCYQPQSKSFKNDPNTKYTKAGVLWAANPLCLGQGGTDTTCYWCIQ
ncbi:MAG: prepilin-type N-terminal cleavage/methylation domain-containing protein [Candidatus Gottesmanbacteria bacterium]|nr:prepilin-type N-terminal cleavage/methylation domain-containing protein [Candidatus Gottesmanbacteria bacterium]